MSGKSDEEVGDGYVLRFGRTDGGSDGFGPIAEAKAEEIMVLDKRIRNIRPRKNQKSLWR